MNIPFKPPDKVLRPRTGAARLGVSIATYYRWEKRPGWPRKIRMGPRSVGVLESELMQWLRDNMEGASVQTSDNKEEVSK